MNDLPVEHVIIDVRQALACSGVAVLEAPPGAGKTTLVPLRLLEEPWLCGQKILLLEPRRLAARNAAARMAFLLGEEVGQTVGYRVRLESRVGPGTRIEVLTEGILTRLLQEDPGLDGVGLVIFDEFHERSLQADLGLALALDTRTALREDLRLLVMSATLDGDSVAAMLGSAPRVVSEGRSFPVETRHMPLPRGVRGFPLAHVVAAVRRALVEEDGSILVFLPGVAEIRRVEAALGDLGPDVRLCPLYGDLSRAAQDAALVPAPPGCRKVVLATAIAETSLTIDGVAVVVDSGLMRAPRFDAASGMSRLETLRVTRDAADQRRGRAGRLGPGVCYRLWGEHEYLLEHRTPEIRNADLAPLALELAVWGVADSTALSWLDPPPAQALNGARELLKALAACDAAGRITTHGRAMAELGLHPRLAHMILWGTERGLGDAACRLAALMGERDIMRDAERGADVRERLALLGERGPGRNVDGAACRRIVRQAGQWRRRCGARGGSTEDAGVLLAAAWPERLARRRPGAPGRYLMASGGGAWLPVTDPLAGEEFLAVAALDGQAEEARIFLAAPLSREDIENLGSERICVEEQVQWEHGRVLARRRRLLGSIVLDEQPLRNPDERLVREVLFSGLRQDGLGGLPWTRELADLRARLDFVRRYDAEGDWPDVSDEALLDNLDAWLGPFVDGARGQGDIGGAVLDEAFRAQLSWSQKNRLDELAPERIRVPSGSRIAVDYTQDPPVLAVRLQEMFGCRETPVVGGGRVRVLLHLLSPARRPLQITRDLEGFWSGSYHEVKREMKGRYPKHYWPDDPFSAAPTARAKPRGG